MKKIVLLLVVICLIIRSGVCVHAEETKVKLTKGTLHKTEIITLSSLLVAGFDDKVLAKAVILTDMQSDNKNYALMLESDYNSSEYTNGTSIVLLDIDELESVILALKSIKTELSKPQRNYTEYVYETTNGLKIGARYDGKITVFISFSALDTKCCDYKYIDNVMRFFSKCKMSIEKEMK